MRKLWVCLAFLSLMMSEPVIAAGNDDPALMLDIAIERIKERNFEKANVILGMLAEDGDPGALYHLGRAHKRGWGVPQNDAKALRLFSRAYEPQSRYRGLVAYEVGRIFQGMKTDEGYETAVLWFKRSLRHGYAKAASQLGVLYATGRGVSRDHRVAAQHYSVAARAGNGASMIAYSRYLRQGRYVKRNIAEANGWISKAIKRLSDQANRGSGSAAIRIGRLYLKGEGVEKDLGKAKRWFRQASKNGDRRANAYLSQISELAG